MLPSYFGLIAIANYTSIRQYRYLVTFSYFTLFSFCTGMVLQMLTDAYGGPLYPPRRGMTLTDSQQAWEFACFATPMLLFAIGLTCWRIEADRYTEATNLIMLIENPYASPLAFDESLIAITPRQTNWLRGLAMSILWQGIGFVAILAIAFAARILFSGAFPLHARLRLAADELPHFIGPANFFGAFFALAAIATFAPGLRSRFSQTLALIFLSFILWLSFLAIVTFPFQWPLMAFPSTAHRYQPSLAVQLWVGFWFLLGPALYTAHLTRRRIAKS